MKIREIDPVAAARLYGQGYPYDEIGRILALRRGRRSPFWAESVRKAISLYDRRAAACQSHAEHVIGTPRP